MATSREQLATKRMNLRKMAREGNSEELTLEMINAVAFECELDKNDLRRNLVHEILLVKPRIPLTLDHRIILKRLLTHEFLGYLTPRYIIENICSRNLEFKEDKESESLRQQNARTEIELMHWLLDNRLDVNSVEVGAEHHSLLVVAAKNNKLHLVKQLMERSDIDLLAPISKALIASDLDGIATHGQLALAVMTRNYESGEFAGPLKQEAEKLIADLKKKIADAENAKESKADKKPTVSTVASLVVRGIASATASPHSMSTISGQMEDKRESATAPAPLSVFVHPGKAATISKCAIM